MKQLILAIVLAFSSLTFAYDTVDPVVNKAIATGEISRADARNIYLLKNRAWADGAKILVFRMSLNSPLHREFVRDVLNMSVQQFEAEWQKLVSVGLSPNIGEVVNSRDMLSTLNRKPNSIGYLDHSYLILNAGGYDVKIIRITDK